MNVKTNFSGKKIAVLGAAVEGVSSALYLAKHGAVVTLLDQNEKIEKEILNQVESQRNPVANGVRDDMHQRMITCIGGKDYLEGLEKYDIVVRSPGIKQNLPQLIAAEEKGVKITSQTILFFENSPAPIIGVTGTKGKGTTSSLIYEMLKEQSLDVYLGGNIGVPPFTFLDNLTPSSWVVLELSSFQLEDMQQSPHIAVMLMVTSDHLGADTTGTQNYHADINEYVEAKRNIVRWQTPTDYAVLNRDYPAAHESDIYTDGKVFQVSREREAAGEGCFVRNGMIVVRRDGKEQEIMSADEILLPGKHNWENVCAAVMAASLAGVSKTAMVSVLRTFKGLEHRLELVKEVRGVKYYDDSFSTTPETAMAAIDSFDGPEILILGGSSKGSDFTALGTMVSLRPNIRAVIGIGKEWERIKEHITNKELNMVEGLQSMAEVVKTASQLAQPGDIVLLSPACASFGMFKNYKERGEQFKQAVRQLA